MGNKKEEASLAGREKHWLRDYSSIGLPGGVCSPYPVNSLNCTLQRPFRPGSAQAPPGYSMERIYHREESILKFSFLLLPFSTILLLSLSLLSLLYPFPFSFSFLFLSFLLRGTILGRLPPNLQSFCLSFHKVFWLQVCATTTQFYFLRLTPNWN